MKHVKSIALAGILVVTFTATAFAKTGVISATKTGVISATKTGVISATKTGVISATKTGVISATKTETNSAANTMGVNANVSAFQIALFELLLTLF
jgi:hypothetical protein